MTSVRRRATVAAYAATLLAAVVVALALLASPAAAFDGWQHDGAAGCSCHSQGKPTDATCTACHKHYASYPGETCWSCHAPGEDTSRLSRPSAACSQECHLWDPATRSYVVPSSHGTNPHLGSSTQCLACHSTSQSMFDPGDSPHHSGEANGMNPCTACHSQQQHAGSVACTRCHKDANAFHAYQADSPGYIKCGSCHVMRHAGKRVPTGKCARCHEGVSGDPAQHATDITKKYVCGACHSQRLHASRVSSAVKSCRTCHTSRYHRSQPVPPRSVCTRCHGSAVRHANGYQCWLCHRAAVHNPTPRAQN